MPRTATAASYDDKSAAAAGNATKLREQAAALRTYADENQRSATQFNAIANQYSERFKDMYFNYVSTSAGYASYRSDQFCTGTNWIGKCNAWDSTTIKVPSVVTEVGRTIQESVQETHYARTGAVQSIGKFGKWTREWEANSDSEHPKKSAPSGCASLSHAHRSLSPLAGVNRFQLYRHQQPEK